MAKVGGKCVENRETMKKKLEGMNIFSLQLVALIMELFS